jgi:hypothetical protein
LHFGQKILSFLRQCATPKHLEVFQSVTAAIPAACLFGVLSGDGILVHSGFIYKVLPAANSSRGELPAANFPPRPSASTFRGERTRKKVLEQAYITQ